MTAEAVLAAMPMAMMVSRAFFMSKVRYDILPHAMRHCDSVHIVSNPEVPSTNIDRLRSDSLEARGCP